MIGNGHNIKCTHKGLLDVICIENDGSTARDTCEIKLVPQLNHDLFSFMRAMKDRWQMNGTWKKHLIEIELCKKGHESFLVDRMKSSGSLCLIGVKLNQVLGQAHAVIEPGKRFSMNKLHQITGHTERHLIGPTSHYWEVK